MIAFILPCLPSSPPFLLVLNIILNIYEILKLTHLPKALSLPAKSFLQVSQR